jgi:hypothetical protein
MSFNVQSCSGRDRKVLNFLVVVVVIYDIYMIHIYMI